MTVAFERDAEIFGLIMNTIWMPVIKIAFTANKATASIYSMKSSITNEPARVFSGVTSVVSSGLEGSRQIVETVLSEEFAPKSVEALATVMIRDEANYHGEFTPLQWQC